MRIQIGIICWRPQTTLFNRKCRLQEVFSRCLRVSLSLYVSLSLCVSILTVCVESEKKVKKATRTNSAILKWRSFFPAFFFLFQRVDVKFCQNFYCVLNKFWCYKLIHSVKVHDSAAGPKEWNEKEGKKLCEFPQSPY